MVESGGGGWGRVLQLLHGVTDSFEIVPIYVCTFCLNRTGRSLLLDT